MNLLSVEGVSKRFGERLLFEDLTFGIDLGQKVALVAKNGEGKTTLLHLLLGRLSPDTGQVVWRNSLKVAYLEQQEVFSDELQFEDVFAQANNPRANALQTYQEAIDQDKSAEEINDSLNQLEQLDAWSYEAEVEKLLEVFQLNLISKTQKVNDLSGGQRKRISLLKMILEEPDVYIMDEPTNHLDVHMIEWLEDYFSAESRTVLLVSHDRYFLNRVCNTLIEISGGKAYKYQGNYSYFLEKKAEREEIEASEISKAKNLYRKELEWVRRMPKARGTKSKSRVDDFKDIEKKAKKRNQEEELHLEIKSERLGSKILEFHHVKKAFGDLKILADFSYVFKQGEKIGIAGNNGVGKTTFLNLILGKEQADGGKIVAGETVRFGYYSQSGFKIPDGKRIIEVVKDIAEQIPLAKGRKISASQLLERFLFPPKQQYNYVSKLSGGEKKRLYLLTILMANPNFLILDEPTNDLDISTIAILEDFLQDFSGCLLLVSHDRAFMDHLADHIFHFKGAGQVKDFNGTYSELIEKNRKTVQPSPKPSPKDIAPRLEKTQVKLSFQERKEFNRLEKEIEKLEAKKLNLNEELNAAASDAELLLKLSDELMELQSKLEEKEMRWLELAERA